MRGHVAAAKLAAIAEDLRLREPDLTWADIAERLGKSTRTIHTARATARKYTAAQQHPDPKPVDKLTEEARAMLEWTPDAFETFYVRFSPYDYLPKHSKAIVSAAMGSKFSVLNVPPGHAKSQVMAVWFPIWLITRDRNSMLVILSKTGDLALQRAREIANELSNNTDLISTFGLFKPETQDVPWHPNSGEFVVAGRSGDMERSGSWTLQSRGAGQQIFGVRLTHLIVDDLVDTKNTLTPKTRSDLEKWFRGEALSRFKGGKTAPWSIVIGTRFHPDDLYGKLLKDKRGDGKDFWEHINFPAIITWPVEENAADAVVLWPEEWPYERLITEAYVLAGGKSGFSQMYQQMPSAEGSTIIEREWIYGTELYPGCLDKERDVGEGFKQEAGAYLPIVRVVSVDPSPTRYWAIVVAEVLHNRDYFYCTIMEIIRDKLDVRRAVEHLNGIFALYKPDYLIFEQNAAQRWFLQDPSMDEFRRKARVIPHTTSIRKADPQLGYESMAYDFEMGHIRLPYASPAARSQSQLLIEEALSVPWGDTDDVMMATWFMKANYARLVPRSYESSPGAPKKRFQIPPRLRRGFK